MPLGWRFVAGPTSTVERQVYKSGVGERRRIRLPDGSMMTLDANSRVTVALVAAGRALDLTRGAARFQVRHDVSRPFTVATPDASVTALGTDFSIDRAAESTSVQIFGGQVRLTVPGRTAVALAAGERATVRAGGVSLGRGDVPHGADWESDWLEAGALRLDVALARLSRYSSRPIRLGDPRLAGAFVGGRFRLDAPERSAAQIGELFDLTPVARDGALWLDPRARRVGATTVSAPPDQR
nr:FecR domain-containing protein [Sphingomonas yunnanensis]